MRRLYGLGAWTPAQDDEANRRVGGLYDALDVAYQMITNAEQQDYPPAVIDRAYSDHDALGAEIDALAEEYARASEQGTPGSLQSFIQHLEALEARVYAFDPFGAKAQQSRTSMVVGATVGSIVIAGLVAGGLWLFLGRRRSA